MPLTFDGAHGQTMLCSAQGLLEYENEARMVKGSCHTSDSIPCLLDEI